MKLIWCTNYDAFASFPIYSNAQSGKWVYDLYIHLLLIEAVSYSSKSTVIVTCNVRPPASIWIVLASSITLTTEYNSKKWEGWINKKAKSKKIIIDERFGILLHSVIISQDRAWIQSYIDLWSYQFSKLPCLLIVKY